jgi:hypothetical protein
VFDTENAKQIRLNLKDSDDRMSHLRRFSTPSVCYNNVKDTVLRRQNQSLWVVASNSLACWSQLTKRLKKGGLMVSPKHIVLLLVIALNRT